MHNAAETAIVATDNSESHAGEPPDSSELRASRRVFPFRYSLAIASSIVICYALVMFILRDDPEATVAFTDLALIPINGMAALALLYAAASSYQQRKKGYLTWLILSLATFSFTMGDVIWAYEETILKVDPFFSISNVFFLAYYPLFLWGIFVLPSLEFPLRERFKIALDFGIVMFAGIIIFWNYIISPVVQESANYDLFTLIIYIIYPLGDLILLFSVLELLFRKIRGNEQTSLLLLAAGMICLIITDSIFLQLSWFDAYAAGGLLDLGWPLSYALVGLAGMSQADVALKKNSFKIPEFGEFRSGGLTWPLYIPYLFAAGAFALLVWSHENPIGISFASLSWAVGMIIGLVILRQILVLNENVSLYKKAQKDIQEKELARAEVIRLNEELEERVARRTKQLEDANRDLQCEVQERIQAEAAMRDSEHRMADIINFLPDATFVINKEGVVIAWNRAIEMMTQVKAEDILGKGEYEYSLPFYKKRRPILIDLVTNQNLDAEGCYEELKWHEDGSLAGVSFISNLNGKLTYLQGSAAVLYDSEGNIYGAIESIRDITDQKMVEEDLKNSKERAELATRSKSNFLANMSHEIRTPMNAVVGMTGLLLETDLKPEQRDYLETIRTGGNTLLAIINNILDYSKIEGEKMELEILPFDLLGCIEESMDMVAAKAAEKGLEIAYFQDDDVPRFIVGDQIRLRQILVNLLGNATKFTEKGEIVLSLSTTPLDDGRIELHFKVMDTGIGISQENLSRLFQFFTQVDSSTTRHYGGTGLGLAISRRLVEMMEGRIWVESEKGAGSTFHFTIRCQLHHDDSRSETGDSILSGKRVLIVEGHKSVRDMLVRMASSWGMEAVALARAEEAIELMTRGTSAETDQLKADTSEMTASEATARVTDAKMMTAGNLQDNSFDFAILDTVLPDMEGLLLARQIMEKGFASFVVMISQMGEMVQKDDSLSGWLTKPVKPHLLKRLFIDLISPSKGKLQDLEAQSTSSRETSDLSILLAEDNPINQKVALLMLKHLGYRADVASSGPEVLASVKRKQYDVILMDIQMPDMDGLEATRHIREMDGSISQPHIIAMTAYALEGDREEFLKAGMNGYLSKPIQLGELKSALESVKPID
ncbi:MAG: response regulator [Methanothrix soehngenii]|nr:response regulator [Methanothrix soehngenii]